MATSNRIKSGFDFLGVLNGVYAVNGVAHDELFVPIFKQEPNRQTHGGAVVHILVNRGSYADQGHAHRFLVPDEISRSADPVAVLARLL